MHALSSEADAPGSTDAAATFAEISPQLFGIAYRVLGSAVEAEDILQEAWIRWQNCDRTRVRHAFAFLATTTARLANNAAQSARARHETYIDRWLPEPVDTTADPELAAERGEAVELAIQLMFETLSPTERAAYVLRQAFDYPYEEIARIIKQTQASVRQHVSRARKRLTEHKRTAVRSDAQRQLLYAFVAGAQGGNLNLLEQLLAADVVGQGERRRDARGCAKTRIRHECHGC